MCVQDTATNAAAQVETSHAIATAQALKGLDKDDINTAFGSGKRESILHIYHTVRLVGGWLQTNKPLMKQVDLLQWLNAEADKQLLADNSRATLLKRSAFNRLVRIVESLRHQKYPFDDDSEVAQTRLAHDLKKGLAVGGILYQCNCK
jgi:hypothetical protein